MSLVRRRNRFLTYWSLHWLIVLALLWVPQAAHAMAQKTASGDFLTQQGASEVVIPLQAALCLGLRDLEQKIASKQCVAQNNYLAHAPANPDTSKPGGVRMRAMLETLYSTGMRRLELINLDRFDVDVLRGTVMIRHGKGDKDRVIPIGERALAWIQKYSDEVRPGLALAQDCGALFITDSGEPFKRINLTALVKKIIQRAQVNKPGSCHLFRHTMATLMLENGADIRFIQAMLGHAQLTTTQVYTQVSIVKLKEIHTLTHPARLRPTLGGGTGTDTNPSQGQDQKQEFAADLLAALEDEATDEATDEARDEISQADQGHITAS